MVYKVTEAEYLDEEDEELIKYETFHYDDYIKLEVFQKGSLQKNSKLGKAFINVRELNCKVFTENINESRAGQQRFTKVPITFKPSNYG